MQKRSNLVFDHTFTTDDKHQFLKSLVKLGFRDSGKLTEHPGGALCRFIAFPKRKNARASCLEFVAFRKLTKDFSHPGLSFRRDSGLEAFFRSIKSNKRLKPVFEHRNYEWKKNSSDRLPGWNFVYFKNGAKNCLVWITEYEQGRKKSRPMPHNHPNGATAIVGVEFELSSKDWKFFEMLLGVKLKEQMVFPCGTQFIFRRAKASRQKAVVVAVRDLDSLNQKKHKLELTAFAGRPALKVKNPYPHMWDLLLVQA